MTNKARPARRPASRALPLAQVPEGCPFCHEATVAPGVLMETPQFLVVCDRAPLVPGHLLLIPRQHIACYGALPRPLYSEFRALKARLAAFLAEAYAPPVFFEHGVVAQTVPHAHLHAVPARLDLPLAALLAQREAAAARGLGGLRRWYDAHGSYVYYEADERGYLLPPDGTPAGNLKTAFGQALGPTRPAPDDVPAITRDVRQRWQRFEQAHGRPTTRVVTCFLEHAGAICLLKRSEAVGSGRGKWHAVSGYLPEGKDPLGHAYDELAEETGLTPGHVELRRHAGPVLFADRAGGRPWEVDAFLFRAGTPALSLNWEHVEYVWVPPERLADYDCFPWLRALYEAVADGVGAASANSRP
ncbi:MAG TPA: HIT domain-containing protein [Chloroflexota bacterium]|nr:HIT domain-containing protein [Chloroflexota bacterium]